MPPPPPPLAPPRLIGGPRVCARSGTVEEGEFVEALLPMENEALDEWMRYCLHD